MLAYKKYFMHGTSHFLGLDVHDVGLVDRPIENAIQKCKHHFPGLASS